MGRGAADIASFGIAHLARRTCKMCGHPMSEHPTAASTPVAIPDQIDLNPARWVKLDDGRHRWWNGENWTDYYTLYPHDPAAVGRVMASLAEPPKWVKQEDGRLRWWAGEEWSDSWKADPEVIDVVAAPALSSADEIKKLADLHTAGVLTDDEFAAAKKKLLGI
jgi:hypothetical protein